MTFCAVWASGDARSSTGAEYDITGTITQLGANTAGLFPANATVGSPYDLQVVVDTSVAGIGDNVSLETYRQASAGGPFPVQSASLELTGSAPIEIFGTSSLAMQSPLDHVTVEHNEVLSGGSFVDELVFGMTGVQATGNTGEFTVVAIDQTFRTPPGFTTSVQLGAPLGTTPAIAINNQAGNLPVSFSVCGDAMCSTSSIFSGAVSEITVSPVPLPSSFGLLLSGLAAIAGGLRVARFRGQPV